MYIFFLINLEVGYESVNILSYFLQLTFNHIFSICCLQSTFLGTGDIYKKEEIIIALKKSAFLKVN